MNTQAPLRLQRSSGAAPTLLGFSLTLACNFLFSVSSHAADAAPYEKPPTFRAADVLTSAERSGDGFKVHDEVASDGYIYIFSAQTEWGEYHMRSLATLRKREFEFAVMRKLDEFTDSKVFLDAAEQAGIDIVMAPVNVVTRVGGAVTDPEKTWNTVKKVPSGVVGLFSSIADQVGSGASTAYRAVAGSEKDAKNSDKAGQANSKEDATAELTNKATDAGLKYIGYSKKETEWYLRYGLDQFTTNKPLRDKISRIASVQSAVKLASKFLPGIGGLGMLSTANSVLSKAEKLALYASPEEQKKKNKDLLLAMGASEAQVTAFLDNKMYSSSAQSRIVFALNRMKEVKGRQGLLDASTSAETEEGAQFYMQSIEYLSSKEREKEGLLTAIAHERLPILTTSKKVAIVPLAVDYLIWNEDVATISKHLSARFKKEFPGMRIEYRLSGLASPICRKALGAQGATVLEKQF